MLAHAGASAGWRSASRSCCASRGMQLRRLAPALPQRQRQQQQQRRRQGAGGGTCRHVATNVASVSVLGSMEIAQTALVVMSRQQLLQRAPFRLLRLAGVTFENRQELVQQLAPGQPVIFAKDPGNPHDPLAVAVTTLDGRQLGYVAHTVNRAFMLQVCFGSVASVGQGLSSGHWGARVSVCPSLRGLELDLLPDAWEERADMEQLAGGEAAWRGLQQAVLQRYRSRCAVTSTPAADVPLHVVPSWALDARARRVRLGGLVPLAQPLAQAREVLRLGATAPLAERQAALELLRHVMQWPEGEPAKYVRFAEEQRRQAEQGGWELELPALGDLEQAAHGAASPGPGGPDAN